MAQAQAGMSGVREVGAVRNSSTVGYRGGVLEEPAVRFGGPSTGVDLGPEKPLVGGGESTE